MTDGERSLRIALMLESDGPGGAEMMVFRLAEELRRRGHTIVPVGPEHGVGWLGAMFRDAGFTPEVFRLRRTLDPGCVTGLRRLFVEHSVDVVHSHEFTMAVYGAAAALSVGVPHLITMHGGLKACKALRRRVALRWAMRQSAYTVVVSRATQMQFAGELGLPERDFVVVPNGVPALAGDAGQVRSEFGISPGEVVLLAVGTLERHKGHAVLLEALGMLRQRHQEAPWRLVIAGGRGGDQHQSLLQLAARLGIERRVHIVTGRSDIADLQALADVFVMPSLWEGLPMALLEAMVPGNAIVASATAGIPEAIEHDRDGLLVPPGDPGALADALGALLIDPARRSRLGAAAARRADAEFTVRVMAERYERLYGAAIADTRGTPERVA